MRKAKVEDKRKKLKQLIKIIGNEQHIKSATPESHIVHDTSAELTKLQQENSRLKDANKSLEEKNKV